MEETRIRKDRPIKAYIFTSQGSLIKPGNNRWVSFTSLEEGLAKFKEIKPRFIGKQILFVDYSITPARIVHLLNQE
jgi:hypothetical protein